jgi:hypothetical protein
MDERKEKIEVNDSMPAYLDMLVRIEDESGKCLLRIATEHGDGYSDTCRGCDGFDRGCGDYTGYKGPA